MSTVPNTISAGFADPVHDAQAAFRAVLDALSRPGKPLTIGQAVEGLSLGPAMAHLLLALTDDDTPVWWQKNQVDASSWLRFHTGAPVANAPETATFAVVVDVAGMPPLSGFAAGSVESPERSATLLIEVPSLTDGPATDWRGPGIANLQTVRIAGLPETFWAQWQTSQAAFPQGVDIVFACGSAVLGMPRTTRAQKTEGS